MHAIVLLIVIDIQIKVAENYLQYITWCRIKALAIFSYT